LRHSLRSLRADRA